MPPPLPSERSETSFADFKPAYTPGQASMEANRCLFCNDAPCIAACPTGIDIPGFIRKIATGNLRGSARSIFDANILGMSCARVCPVEVLCVGDCVYHHMGVPPIQIGKLQRHATDVAYGEGWRFFEAGPDTGKSIGLVGAGPASLAAAHELRRLGHACAVYERRSVLGGLNTTGVAPYKMRGDRSLSEVAWILRIGGVAIETGVRVPDDVSWDELSSRHDALFIGLGLGADRLLDLPGSDLQGVGGAVAWIEAMKLGAVDLSGVQSAVVLGGGNTAIDAVRELTGLGIPKTTMVYRRTEARMSGYAHEWAAAKQQGIAAAWARQPIAYEGDGGRVAGVRCVHLDDDAQAVEGSGHVIPADLVLLAIGQARLADVVSGLDGVAIEDGRLVVDEHGATGRPGVYAGGDCANGGKEVVNAAAEGKAAARAIDTWLDGKE
ncbi:MAG: glutamate synthase [Planctomycetes bacterium]|nr:glutamate synthase [Planctomycetota bacterium]